MKSFCSAARFAAAAFAVAVPLLASTARADIVHESSIRNPGPTGGGFILGGGAGYVQGSRFHLDSTTEIQFGGGRVNPHLFGSDTLEVSIVQLDMSGLPANTPATMTALVSGTAPSPTSDVDLLVPLPITLAPGDYGIVLSALDPDSQSTFMPMDNTNNPGASYFSGTSDGWADGNGAIPGFYARFVLYNGCGDDVLAADEVCDDGNTVPDDGCDPMCRDLCGDLVVGPSEDCEDGNLLSDDCCDVACNLPSVAGCFVAGAGSFGVTDTTPDDKDQLQWKWQKGSAVDIEDFGNPATTTSFTLCVDQDRAGSNARNVGTISLSPVEWWTGGERSWKLKDQTGAVELGGIASGTLKPGDAGKSSVRLKGAGTLLPSLPLAPDDDVTVTLRTTGAGTCWTSGAMPVIKSTDTKTTARLP